MDDDRTEPALDLVGAWAKRCYFAGRAVMDAALRPYDLGSVQWYVLHRLVEDGPTLQRDLVRRLDVERATLSGIVATLVRKGLVEQESDQTDQRQKRLRLTAAGTALWYELPDLSLWIGTALWYELPDLSLWIENGLNPGHPSYVALSFVYHF